MTFDEVRHYVAQRKAMYQRSLAQADKMLQAMVSQDPARLAEARRVQAEYAPTCAVLELKAAEHPQTSKPAPKTVVSQPALNTGAKPEFGKAGDGGAPVK